MGFPYVRRSFSARHYQLRRAMQLIQSGYQGCFMSERGPHTMPKVDKRSIGKVFGCCFGNLSCHKRKIIHKGLGNSVFMAWIAHCINRVFLAYLACDGPECVRPPSRMRYEHQRHSLCPLFSVEVDNPIVHDTAFQMPFTGFQ